MSRPEAPAALADAHVAWAGLFTPWLLSDEQVYRSLLHARPDTRRWRVLSAEATRRGIEAPTTEGGPYHVAL